jgi:DNA-binding CsgD family transcriptional regulator
VIPESKLDSLLLQLSEVTLSSSSWDGWLVELGQALEAPHVSLVPLRSDPFRFVQGAAVGYSDAQRQVYGTYFGHIDIYCDKLLHAPDLLAQPATALVPEAELLKSEIYNDWWRPYGLRYALSTPIDVGSTSRYVLSCVRSNDQSEFTDEETLLFGRIARHVRQQIRVEHVLSDTKTQLNAHQWALEQLAVPTFLLEKDLRIVFVNDAGVQFLRRGVVETRNGRLTGVDPRIGKRLEEAVSLVACGKRMQQFLVMNSSVALHRTSAMALRIPRQSDRFHGDVGPHPDVLLFFLDHQSNSHPSPQQLAAAFDFTPREASTASLFARGHTIDEIAERLSISREGVRHHLKRLFWKTETHNQRQLVQTIANVVGPLRPWPDGGE